MPSVTLTTLRSRVRELSDMQNAEFVTDDAVSLDSFLNASCQRLHLKLVERLGADYAYKTQALTTSKGTTDYPLPADFLTLHGVDLTLSGDVTPIRPFMFSQRGALRSNSFADGTAPRYRKLGQNLQLLPAPTGVYSGTIHYAPELALLVNGSDSVSFPGGMEEWAVIDSAIQVLLKQESDASALFARLSQVEQAMNELASNRDAGEPDVVIDVDSIGDYSNGAGFWRGSW